MVMTVFGWLIGTYAVLGVLAALALHAGGLRRIDPAVSGGGVLFRLLITPGLVALWPLLAARYFARRQGRDFLGRVESPLASRQIRTLHLLLALALALLIPGALVLAALLRPGLDPSRVEIPPGKPAPIPLTPAEPPGSGN